MIETIIAALIVAAVVGGAIGYVVKQKKRGTTCIGCPHGGKCESCRASRLR